MGSHASAPEPDQSARALDAFRRIVRALRDASETTEARSGVSGAQLFVLQILSREDGLSLGDVAQRTLTHQSSVSVVVQRLVDKRLVSRRRSKVDGRRVELALTPSGTRLVERATDTPQERLVAAIRALPAEQRGTFAESLEQVVGHMDLAARMPTMFFEDNTPRTKRARRHERT